ncbi:Alginate export [Bryocella elongata]|uniref:Alginate export n=1 Tax=Bryocella elongata TaxID=863522 RepID=A0A1H5TYG1_9BACT|nr:alginate export family protein [Bryocella elongata]SEF67057.1 Alginate export [Bryocella elongata]
MFSSRRTLAVAVSLLACTLAAPLSVLAQKSIYIDYPQKKGKTQGLEWTALPSWITLDMELRQRTEGQTAFSQALNADRDYQLSRVRGGLEVRPSSWLTAYAQFHDTHALGLPLHTVSSNMRDTFDLRQGYLDLHHGPVHLLAGRQELKFGGERLVGISDWTNNSRTFDGFDLRIGNRNRVDVFTASVVTVAPTSLDKHGAGLTFHGIDASIVSIPKVHIEPYLFIKAIRKVTSAENIAGSELAWTPGVDIEGKLPAGFCYNLNAALQRGSYSNDGIRSGQAYGKLFYSATKLPWKPRLGAEVDYATGNNHALAGRWSTFDQLYPSNHNAFGLTDIFGYQNIRQERLNLDLLPTKDLSILVQGSFLEMATTRDSVYTSSGSALIKVPTAGFTSDHLGEEFDASAKYVWHNYVVANIGVGHFFADSPAMVNAKKYDNTLAYFSLVYRYRVDKRGEEAN